MNFTVEIEVAPTPVTVRETIRVRAAAIRHGIFASTPPGPIGNRVVVGFDLLDVGRRRPSNIALPIDNGCGFASDERT
jgi:hypothetical protein